ncbi:head GIN domain-containing protein [Pseudoduganella namucuonensis]|uniref:Putative auto-transporter adhesin, head GIN domain n=1 Tax=Pseudoduganella namucuonensis TaxID=1035707 RepID=A0A1I7J718_9BURK|nr:head GIN domain-containing protein [Pseudoduganella namucuonensis]SFU80999.1 Putative auto-transporter adhesin, head GIN domain [Pseudoduganella namucuonensis]
MAVSNKVASAVRNALLAASALAVVVPAVTAQAGPLNWLRGGEHVQGSGKVTKQTREMGHFTGLALAVPGEVEVRLGANESVTIETDDNLQALVETAIENGTLRIRPVRRDLRLDTRNMKVVVQARNVDRISVGGSGSVDAENLKAAKLQFDVGGSGSINVRGMESEAVAVSLGGSGSLKASGNTGRLQVSIGGSGKVQTDKLEARDVSVSIGGSGRATVWAKQSLNLSVAGSGDIGYYGDPQLSKSIMGSGSVKRLGAAPQ